MFKTATTAALAAILLSSVTAMAADPVCGDVNGNYAVSTADALLVLRKGVGQSVTLNCSGYDDQFSACSSKLATANAGTAAPGDVVEGKTFTSASGLGVVGTRSSCGDGAIDDGESCDFGNLNSETCSTQTGGAKPSGTLHCAVGCAGFDTSGCKLRFEHRFAEGALTVVDNQTGLEWVVTDDAGGLTDKDNLYTWSTGDDSFNGTAKTDYIDGLNDVAGGGANCFAGHCDWRLPSIAKEGEDAELETILLAPFPCVSHPCIDEAVFGPTQSEKYWSSSTYGSLSMSGDPSIAWGVDFYDGSEPLPTKTSVQYVRAVRKLRYLPASVGGDATVLDTETYLEWVVTDNDGGLTDQGNFYTWSTGDQSFNGTAKTDYIDGLNDVAGGGADCYAGHCDWRVPSMANDGDKAELETIVDCRFGDPCIDEDAFGPTQSNGYWSSSTYQSDSVYAWYVDFGNGNPNARDKTLSFYFRAVRDARYISSSVGGDATVLDRKTDLEWIVTDDAGGLTDKDNSYTWSTGDQSFNGTAKTVYIDGLNDVAGGGANCFAGHCDWRLPSMSTFGDAAELETLPLAPFPCDINPCIDESVFGPTQSEYYWSSSTYVFPEFALTIHFSVGSSQGREKTYSYPVRAVRPGS